jgi:hypothetical protein
MTELKHLVRREFRSPVFTNLIVVSLHPDGFIGFKAKRQRKEYRIPIELCYHQAIKYQNDLTERRKNVRRQR